MKTLFLLRLFQKSERACSVPLTEQAAFRAGTRFRFNYPDRMRWGDLWHGREVKFGMVWKELADDTQQREKEGEQQGREDSHRIVPPARRTRPALGRDAAGGQPDHQAIDVSPHGVFQ